MKYIGRVKDNRPGFHRWGIVTRLRVFIIQMSVLVPIHSHTVRHQGIERNDLALAVSDDLGIGISPKKKVRHEGFPEDKGTHLRIRFIMQKPVKAMVDGFLLTAVFRIPIHIQRQACHRLRQDTDTGVNRRHLHGCSFIDSFARCRTTHEKGVGAAARPVLRSIPGTEQST